MTIASGTRKLQMDLDNRITFDDRTISRSNLHLFSNERRLAIPYPGCDRDSNTSRVLSDDIGGQLRPSLPSPRTTHRQRYLATSEASSSGASSRAGWADSVSSSCDSVRNGTSPPSCTQVRTQGRAQVRAQVRAQPCRKVRTQTESIG